MLPIMAVKLVDTTQIEYDATEYRASLMYGYDRIECIPQVGVEMEGCH